MEPNTIKNRPFVRNGKHGLTFNHGVEFPVLMIDEKKEITNAFFISSPLTCTKFSLLKDARGNVMKIVIEMESNLRYEWICFVFDNCVECSPRHFYDSIIGKCSDSYNYNVFRVWEQNLKNLERRQSVYDQRKSKINTYLSNKNNDATSKPATPETYKQCDIFQRDE